MFHTVNASRALLTRRTIKSDGTGIEHWSTDFIGERSKEVLDRPQSLFTEMSSNEVIVSHFHAVEQFQVFVAGSGSLGRHNAGPVTMQYIDRHTGYGPINAGPNGLSYLVLRARTDSGAVYLNKPGYREKLRPSKKRNWLVGPLVLSTEPVLRSRKEIVQNPLLEDKVRDDGVDAYMLRLGGNMEATGPDPQEGGGYYFLVLNGGMAKDGENLSIWSMIFVSSSESPLPIKAGPNGLEALIMQFPRLDT